MKYVCLVYRVERDMRAMSAKERDAFGEASLAYDASLRRSGHLLVAHAFEPVATATTVRVRSGELSVTDGPFAETSEQLSGFVLIDARDLNDAIQVAGKIPLADRASVEVRPVTQLYL